MCGFWTCKLYKFRQNSKGDFTSCPVLMCWLGWAFGIQFFVHEKFIFSSHLSFSVFLCSFWYHGPLTKSNSVDPFLQIVNFQTLKIQLAVTFKVLIITCKMCTWTSVQKFITRTMTFTMIRKNLQKKNFVLLIRIYRTWELLKHRSYTLWVHGLV